MPSRPNGNRTPPPARRLGPLLPGSWVALVLLACLVAFLLVQYSPHREISYTDFTKLVQKNEVKKVTFAGKSRLYGEVKDPAAADVQEYKLSGGRFMAQIPAPEERGGTLLTQLEKNSVEIHYDEDQSSWFPSALVTFLITGLILLVVLVFLLPRLRDPTGGGFLNNYIKSPARRFEKSAKRTTFADVAGMENAKSELQEIVEFLKAPDKFTRLGAQVPKGVLLIGPPGTGKTLLARAVAGEANVPFYSINGSEFIQMFVGVGASRVRDLFKTAKENAPCLVFIDEIDAVGRMRGAGFGGGSDEREQTLNQILSEMDGFQANETVIVVAATNRPDVLDAALLRPGRFDRHVTVDRPTWQGRLSILKVHTRNKPLADDVDLEMVARKMTGMTGADLRNLCNESALLATREGKSKIGKIDFDRAADRVLIGPKREEVLTEDDKRRTAYHEAGHALVCWLEPAADKPIKVSIIPRGRALGVNMMLPEEDRYHHGVDYFKAQLVTAMGGRGADRLVFGQPYAGAENDIKQATRLARYMVTHWGMSDKIGPMSFRVGEEHVFLGKEIQEPRDFSEGTAQLIDEEVQRLLCEADARALELLTTHRADLDRLAEALLEREEMERDDIDRLLRPGSEGPAVVPPPPPEPRPEPVEPPVAAADREPKPILAPSPSLG